MNREMAETGTEMYELASGTSARWGVVINEVLDREEWEIEIESPQVYLVFQLAELSAVGAALAFLRTGPRSTQRPNSLDKQRDKAEITLGRFGSASVSLVWDNEDFLRCFLIVSQEGCSTLRLSFYEEDIGMLIEALEQVVQDLPNANPPAALP